MISGGRGNDSMKMRHRNYRPDYLTQSTKKRYVDRGRRPRRTEREDFEKQPSYHSAHRWMPVSSDRFSTLLAGSLRAAAVTILNAE
jgi:hypothetical protein